LRALRAGIFKIKSTPGTSLPTDEDLFKTVLRGVPGRSDSLPAPAAKEQSPLESPAAIALDASATDPMGTAIPKLGRRPRLTARTL
jgi:hypothetical protein